MIIVSVILTYLKSNKGVLIDALTAIFVKLLKMQISGGFQGWLIKTVVTKFSKEVLEFIEVNLDYVDIKHKANETTDMENRDEATDILNDIIT